MLFMKSQSPVNIPLFFDGKMNVNLVNKAIFQNYSKYNKLLQWAVLKTVTNNRRLICECSTFVNVTSKQWFQGDTRRSNYNFIQKQWYSEDISGPPSNKLPPLMPDFPKIVWPSLLKSIRNFILATFIIKPYFDKEFNLPDFVAGSKKAVEVGIILSLETSATFYIQFKVIFLQNEKLNILLLCTQINNPII